MIASRRLPYIYVQNWKCGCSTIKSTLWTAEHARGLAIPPDYPHRRVEGGPFVSDPKRWEHTEREFVFTVVRNPYVRALSAYLNQVVEHRNAETWGRFAAEHRLGDGPLAFADFLRILAATPHERMNPHWRPQYCAVAPALIPYDFIGSLETFDADIRQILDRIFGQDAAVNDYAPHRTGSSNKLVEHYGPRELALVQAIYAQDFASFGYSLDPAKLERVAGTAPPPDGPIRSWGKAHRLMDAGDAAGAGKELAALRGKVTGPAVDAALLRCYRSMLDRDRRVSADAFAAMEADMCLDYLSADLWKQYGQTLTALGRREDGLVAQINALAMRSPGAAKAARLRRLQWRLALLRASKGRRRAALSAIRPATAGADPLAKAGTLVGKGLLNLVAVSAAAVGAGRWHPDKSLGVAGTRKDRVP